MPATTILALKMQNDSRLSNFIEWYETFYTTTNPDTGRKRKGNVKKFLLEEIDTLLVSGKASATFSNVVQEFKQASVLTPEMQSAKSILSDTDFAKLVELMEKAKKGS
jgi:hypothetical protein